MKIINLAISMLAQIETTAQYEEALASIYELLQKNLIEGSEEANKLAILCSLVEDYEQQHYSFSKP